MLKRMVNLAGGSFKARMVCCARYRRKEKSYTRCVHSRSVKRLFGSVCGRSTRESSGWDEQFYSNHFDEGAGSLRESRTTLLAQHAVVRVDQRPVGRHPLTPEFFPQIL